MSQLKRVISVRLLHAAAGLLFVLVGSSVVSAQDTLTVSLAEFIERGIENSGQVDFERQKVNLAENRIDQAYSQKYLPRFELNTQHGAVPGVVSNKDIPRDEYYLDPDLENDWNNWAIFTRAEVNAVQPIFAWGALNNAVNAARDGARAAEYEFRSKRAGLELRLFELYYSYVLSREIRSLLNEARDKLERIDGEIQKELDNPDSEIDQSDVFKFRVFQSEFEIREAEVRENINYIQSIWEYVLQAGPHTVIEPKQRFLDPVANSIETLDYYKSMALQQRNELKGIDAGIAATQHGIEATRAKNLPMLFLGFTGSYANTPNRPRQDNPFIINSTNYASAGIGFGIRQNLDLFSANTDIDRRKIEHRQAKFLKDAAIDGIMLEVNDRYKNATISEVKVDKIDEAVVTSKKWLRQEQLDYDFGIGETKDLLDAMRKEMELRVQLKQRIYEFNRDMAELYRSAGIPITSLQTVN